MSGPDPSAESGHTTPATPEGLGLAGIAHDVNQMLMVVTGRAGLLRVGESDPARRRHLDAILLAASDAAAMLARLRGRPGAAGRTGADLARVVAEARLLAWPADDAAWGWEEDLGGDLGSSVPAQIVREVLVNLLLNAREALGAGGAVRVEARGDGERVRLRVRDDGPGLPGADPEAVFAAGATASGDPSRGLGLPACRQLVRAYGGELRALDGGGGGAVFELDLPGAAAPAPDAAAPTGPIRPEDAEAPAVLVVDDEAVVREMLQDVLGARGCRVRCCRGPQEARAALADGSYDVALVDRRLPGADGLELATALRADDPCLAIAVMSGWQDEADEASARASAADFVVRKPLALEEIEDILARGARLCAARREPPAPA